MTSRQRTSILLLVALLGSLALRLPTLQAGFAMDDYAQLAMLGGVYPAERAPWDLFTFSTGEPTEVRQLMARGSLAWWSDPHLRLSALRPLSSALMWLDVTLFGHDPFWPHVHTLLWWMALVGAVAWLYGLVLARSTAALAVVLYAVDECHVFPLAWLANRNVLVAAFFGVLGLVAHLRWREHGSGAGAWWSVLAFIFSFAAGEYALASLAYVAAYEIAGARDGWRRRLTGILPLVLLTAAYVTIHRAAGFGAQASGVYFDPLREPLAFLQALSTRAPVLLGDLLLAVPTGRVTFSPQWQPLQGLAGLAGLALIVPLLSVMRQSGDGHAARSGRWMLLAAVMAIFPLCASFVSTRLLVIPAVGGHAAVAVLLRWAWVQWVSRSRQRGASWRWGTAVAAGLAVAHLGLAPWWSFQEQRTIVALNHGSLAAVRSSDIRDEAVKDQRLVVLTAGDPNTLLYPPLIQWSEGGPLPRSWWVLSMAPGRHRLARVDAQTLELTALRAEMLASPVERMFRREDRPLAAGTQVDVPGLSITVMETGRVGPTRVRFRFADVLDGDAVRFLVTTAGALRRYPLPPVGGQVMLAPAPLLYRSEADSLR